MIVFQKGYMIPVDEDQNVQTPKKGLLNIWFAPYWDTGKQAVGAISEEACLVYNLSVY